MYSKRICAFKDSHTTAGLKLALWRITMLMLLLIIATACNSGTTDQPAPSESKVETTSPPAYMGELARYIEESMGRLEVPGASVVLVQGGEVRYLAAFGVRDLESNAPVTPQTLMGIGSTTKTMTAVMIASLVEEGGVTWETPLVEILPSFALADPKLSESVTLRHTLCMCTGVPRAMEEISVRYEEMTAEDIISSLADISLRGSFEHSFNYSSRMLAAGGYLAALADGGKYGSLYEDYIASMQKRVFDPIGMDASTFLVDEAVASGDYATPHGIHLTEELYPLQVDVENVFRPIAPAGSLWSNAEDMGKYLLTMLNGGVSPAGVEVVSPESLALLWEKGVDVDAHVGYGLGWHVEDYHGLKVVHHPGGTAGFASEMVLVPELDLGFALLSNRLDLVSPFGRAVTYRLLELVSGREQQYDGGMRQAADAADKQLQALRTLVTENVAQESIAPYLGEYRNDILGDARLIQHEDGSLAMDFGEYEAELHPLGENQLLFYESLFIGKTLSLAMDADGRPTLTVVGDEATYVFLNQE